MRFSLISLVTLALVANSSACINVSGTTLDGRRHSDAEEGRGVTRHFLFEKANEPIVWNSRLKKLEAVMAGEPTIRDRSDYGGVLVHLGQYEKARDVLIEAERVTPGDYAVASNLGTAYELLGENEKALEWIKRGMERNPDSHRGTEWVHVKILEAKIAVAKDPAWLSRNSVLGVDFGTAPRPALTGVAGASRNTQREEANRVRRGAAYQLSERFQFVKGPDPFVGDVTFDLANAIAVGRNVEEAEDIYLLAQEYGAPRSALAGIRRKLMREISDQARPGSTTWIWTGAFCALVLGIAVVRRAVQVTRL